MAKRRQRGRKAVNEIGEGDIQMMLHHFDGKCCYCHVRLTREPGYDNSLEIDHHISLSEQDENDEYQILEGLTLQNALPSCRSCNRAKKDANPYTWIQSYCPDAEQIIYDIEFYFSQQLETIYV